MKKIKFRAWNKKLKQMFEVRDLIMTPSGQVWIDAINEYKDGKFDKANRNLEWGYDVNVEIMQFTGLLDKNGKEIYEGDIVKHTYWEDWEKKNKTSKNEEVKWEDKYLSWYRGIAPLYGYVGEIEVIGNIYEHPDLLSKENKRE